MESTEYQWLVTEIDLLGQEEKMETEKAIESTRKHCNRKSFSWWQYATLVNNPIRFVGILKSYIPSGTSWRTVDESLKLREISEARCLPFIFWNLTRQSAISLISMNGHYNQCDCRRTRIIGGLGWWCCHWWFIWKHSWGLLCSSRLSFTSCFFGFTSLSLSESMVSFRLL